MDLTEVFCKQIKNSRLQPKISNNRFGWKLRLVYLKYQKSGGSIFLGPFLKVGLNCALFARIYSRNREHRL